MKTCEVFGIEPGDRLTLRRNLAEGGCDVLLIGKDGVPVKVIRIADIAQAEAWAGVMGQAVRACEARIHLPSSSN